HHCRGRIEAGPTNWQTARNLMFPRHHCRGRIEARAGEVVGLDVTEFPRHHCRGRIEAWIVLGESGPLKSTCFHDITVVAELKRTALANNHSQGTSVSTTSLSWPN